jgi:hypothetical protein
MELQQEHESTATADAAGVPAPQQLSDEHRAVLAELERFAATKGVKHFPCPPSILAEFLDSQGDAQMLPIVDAVVAAHDMVGLANPACTSAVKLALNRSPCKNFPRSWSAEDKLVFATLDPLTRAVVLRRENERDTALRAGQNRIAAELKRLRTKPEGN